MAPSELARGGIIRDPLPLIREPDGCELVLPADVVESLTHAVWPTGVDRLIGEGVDPYTAVTTLDPRNTSSRDAGPLDGPERLRCRPGRYADHHGGPSS